MKYDIQKLHRLRSDLRVKMGARSGLSKQYRDVAEALQLNRDAIRQCINDRRSVHWHERNGFAALAQLPEEELRRLDVDPGMAYHYAAMQAQANDIQRRIAESSDEAQALSRLVDACEKYVAGLGVDVMAKPSIETIRVSIARLQAERQAIVDGPQSRAEVRARLAAYAAQQVDAADDLLRVRLFGIAQGDDPRTVLHLAVPAGAPIDFGPMLAAALGPEALTDMLCRFLDVPADTPSAVDRVSRLASIDAEILRLENAEENIIEASEADGAPIARRPDASPAVVLRVPPLLSRAASLLLPGR